jgi:hypothetical protein
MQSNAPTISNIPDRPRVSVLMTTYNGARYIAESIRSVLAQDFADFEFVIVDDNSTDDTRTVIGSFDDSRLRLVASPANCGVVGARNLGFADLRGEYVATIDHDDMWLPSRLREGVALLDANRDTLLVATHMRILQDGKLREVALPPVVSPLLFGWTLLMRCPVAYSSLLFRREAAAQADGTFLRPDLRYADDYELMLRFARIGGVEVLDGKLTTYRVHTTNATWSAADQMYLNAVTALSESFDRWLGNDARDAARLVAWHVSRGQAAKELATLRRLGGYLQRLADDFTASFQANAEQRAQIQGLASEAYWSVLRASLRSGHVWAIREFKFRNTTLRRLADAAASVAVGSLRLPMCLLKRRGSRMEAAA